MVVNPKEIATAGMNFENFAARIADSNQTDDFGTPINECVE